MNNTPDYLQGFHDGKAKAEQNIAEAVNYLNTQIKYFTIYDNQGNLTPNVIISASEFKKLIGILQK